MTNNDGNNSTSPPVESADENSYTLITPDNVAQLAQYKLVAARTDAAYAAAFSQDGKYVAWGDYGSKVNIQRMQDGTLTTLQGGNRGSAVSLQFSGDSRTLAAGLDNGTILLWDIPSSTLRQTFQGPKDWIKYVAISDDGSLVVATTQNGIMQVWRAADGVLLQTLSVENGQVSGPFVPVAISSDGALIAASPSGKGTRIWRVSDWSVQADIEDYASLLAFSHDGRMLATSSAVYRVEDGSRVSRFEEGSLGSGVAFSPDGRLLAVGNTGVKILNVADGQVLNMINESEGSIAGLSFSTDGSTLATASLSYKTARLWRVAPTVEGNQQATPTVPATETQGNHTPVTTGTTVSPTDDATDYSMAGDIVKMGEKKTVKLVVDDADRVTFFVSIFDAGAPPGKTADPSKIALVFSVHGPGGEMVSTEAPTSYGYCVPAGFMGMMAFSCSVDKPSAGMWEATMEVTQASDEGAAFMVQTDFLGGVQVVPELSKTDAAVGESVELKATLQDPAAVAGAAVEAWATLLPDGSSSSGQGTQSTVQLAELGNGVYTGEFKPTEAGSYSISFRAKGRNNLGHNFVRIETALLNVKGGNITP